MALSDIVRDIAYLQAGGKPEGSRTIDKVNKLFDTIRQGGLNVSSIRNQTVQNALKKKQLELQTGRMEREESPATDIITPSITSILGQATPENRGEAIETSRNLAHQTQRRFGNLTRKEALDQGLLKNDEDDIINKGPEEKAVLFNNLSKAQQSAVFSLADDYVKASGDFPKQTDAYRRINASASDPSAAGDLSLIFNYMKLLDPGSTVRESEAASAENAAGVPARVRTLYNRVISGEKLADIQRNDFVKRSKMIYSSALEQNKNITNQFTKRAELFGIPPEIFITDFTSSGYEENTNQDTERPKATSESILDKYVK